MAGKAAGCPAGGNLCSADADRPHGRGRVNVVNSLLQLAFFAVFAAAIWRYVRRPGTVELAVVGVFATTAAIFAISVVDGFAPGIADALQPLAILLLLSQPVLIFVLISLIMPIARWVLMLAAIGFVSAAAAILLPPERTVPALLYVGGYFIVAEGAAAMLLLGESQRRYGIARIRLALAGVSTGLFGAAILVAAVGAAATLGGEQDPSVLFIARTTALLAGIGYLGAFVPPGWLRTAGHRAVAFDLARDLVTASAGAEPELLWRNLAETARGLLGVRKVTITDASGGMLAEVEQASAEQAAAEQAPTEQAPTDEPTRAAPSRRRLTNARVPIATGGRLRATLATQLEGRPLFVEDDLEVLGLLGLMTYRAVEREEAIVQLADARRELEAAAAVRASETRFRALLQAHPNAVLAADAEGTVVWATVPTAELFGGTAGRLHGMALNELIQLDAPLAGEGSSEDGTRRLEATGYRLDGAAFPADVALTPFQLEGRPYELAVVSDASWRHEASLLRDHFLGILSHELRTPITAIYGGTQLLLKRDGRMAAEDRLELLGGIAAESERLQQIIENLLVLARVERGAKFFEPRPVTVKPLLTDVVARERPLWPEMTINLSIADGLPLVAADEEYLTLIVRNLLSNAAKYAGAKATVDVEVRSGRDEVQFRVVDDGPGIRPDEADKLFTLYYRSPGTRTPQGAGIGLFVCKGLVGAMSGRVWARQRAEGGAEFGFALPHFTEEAADTRGRRSPSADGTARAYGRSG